MPGSSLRSQDRIAKPASMTEKMTQEERPWMAGPEKSEDDVGNVSSEGLTERSTGDQALERICNRWIGSPLYSDRANSTPTEQDIEGNFSKEELSELLAKVVQGYATEFVRKAKDELGESFKSFDQRLTALETCLPCPAAVIVEGAAASTEEVDLHMKEGDLEKAEKAENAPENAMEHEIKGEIWDSIMLFASPATRSTPSCILSHFSITLVYAVVMVSCLYVIADGFSSDPYDDFTVDRLKYWRVSDGHDVENVDSYTSTSLVSRVCGSDPALSIATNQRLLFDQAVAYQAEVPIGGIQQGPLLCYCCLVIFGLMMFNEIQDALHHLLGVWSLKRAGKTVIVWEEEKCSIVSISLGRAILGTVGDLLRLAGAGVLYFYGSQWLVYTTGLGDLLVNSAVLGFLLDLQAQIFELGSSHRLRLTIECMEPMKITPFPGKTLLPLVLFFGLLVSTLIMGKNWI